MSDDCTLMMIAYLAIVPSVGAADIGLAILLSITVGIFIALAAMALMLTIGGVVFGLVFSAMRNMGGSSGVSAILASVPMVAASGLVFAWLDSTSWADASPLLKVSGVGVFAWIPAGVIAPYIAWRFYREG